MSFTVLGPAEETQGLSREHGLLRTDPLCLSYGVPSCLSMIHLVFIISVRSTVAGTLFNDIGFL